MKTRENIKICNTIINQLVTWPSKLLYICVPLLFRCVKCQIKQAWTDALEIKLSQHSCTHTPVKSTNGLRIDMQVVWATTVDLCTEMFTYTHFLFSWAAVPYLSCWLITNPRLGKGSCPSSQCLPHPGDLIASIAQLNEYLAACVHDSHTQVLSGKVTKCNKWERVSVGR